MLNRKKLPREAASGNYRLRAPLVLYASLTGRGDVLFNCLKGGRDTAGMLRSLKEFSAADVEEALRHRDGQDDYSKVWNSFKAAKDEPSNNAKLKEAIRLKVMELQKDNGCSNYRIYTDLGLNAGNINSWLKHGDSRKVSYSAAARVLDYVMRYSPVGGRYAG